MISTSPTDAELRAAYDEVVARWRNILPLGGERQRLITAGMHPALIDDAYPITTADVYDRIVTCISDEGVPEDLRGAFIQEFATQQHFKDAERKFPRELIGLSSALNINRLSQDLYWVAYDLGFDPIHITRLKDNLLGLAQMLTAETASPHMDAWDLRHLINLLWEELPFAFTIAGFVATAEPYVGKVTNPKRRGLNYTVGVPADLKPRQVKTSR